jgi:FAD/FMN-containing dehydrogenase
MKKFKPSDKTPQFPSFLQGFNRRWYANNCLAVYLCETNEGVQNALEEAISLYGNAVKVKCGGHCYENFVYNSETKAIIDVTNLNGAGYDADKGYYLDGGGTNWGAFKALFRNFGKVLPAGSCYSVGLGGHICGGGYGLLSRLNGLTIDWLTGVEIVVKDHKDKPARLVYVSKDSIDDEKDLFWAQCGGGGGNFGIITRYYFKELPDAPNSAFITTYAFEWKDLTPSILFDLLLWYKNFSEDSNNWNQFGLFKLNHEANGEIHLIIQTATHDETNSLQKNKALIQQQSAELSSICTHRSPKSSIVGHSSSYIPSMSEDTVLYTYYEATQTLNGSGANQRGKYKSAYMRKEFSMENVLAIYNALKQVPDGLTKSDMAQSLLQVDSYGGMINTVAPNATAIAQRDSIFKLQYQTYWIHEKDDAAYLSWIRDFYSDVYKNTGGTPNPYLDETNNVDGCYYNYPDSDLNDIVGREGAMKLYFLNNLERLKSVKRKWDPNNYFNSAQSIPL